MADAQILGCNPQSIPVVPCPSENKDNASDKQKKPLLPPADYLRPRTLWWAFDWEDAQKRAKKAKINHPDHPKGWEQKDGCVVLIDEIDKAESDVPNGLLEALGANSFHPQGLDQPIIATSTPPLVIITTNEERALPDAFIRRCLVLHLKLPKERSQLIKRLINRGKAHFGEMTTPEVLKIAANCLAVDREEASDRHWHPLPGQAEYLDLLRAVIRQRENDYSAQEELIAEVRQFILRKHPDAAKDDTEAEIEVELETEEKAKQPS